MILQGTFRALASLNLQVIKHYALCWQFVPLFHNRRGAYWHEKLSISHLMQLTGLPLLVNYPVINLDSRDQRPPIRIETTPDLRNTNPVSANVEAHHRLRRHRFLRMASPTRRSHDPRRIA